MSALPRSSRSRSKPASDLRDAAARRSAHSDRSASSTATVNDRTPTPPTSTLGATTDDAGPHSLNPDPADSHNPDTDTTAMAEDTAAVAAIIGHHVDRATRDDAVTYTDTDGHSSSLTELDEALDESADGSVGGTGSAAVANAADTPEDDEDVEDEDNDTEAETERLDATPRSNRSAAAATTATVKTPSKLANELVTMDEQRDGDDAANSPSARHWQENGGAATAAADLADDDRLNGPSPTSSLLHDKAATTDSDIPLAAANGSKKRKRFNVGESSGGEDTDADQPARKRSGSTKDRPAIDASSPPAEMDLEEDNAAVVEEEDAPADASGAAKDEDHELEGGDHVMEDAEEVEDEIVVPAKPAKSKKGKRKGKKATRDHDHVERANGTPAVEVEEAAEGDGEEEDPGAVDEEHAKKKTAMEALGGIEKQFQTFREKMVNERIAQLTRELNLLDQPGAPHTDFQTMVRALEERRDDKIQIETKLLHYKRRCLDTQTVAQRSQILAQYRQTARELRENAIDLCGQFWHELQVGRRKWGADEKDFVYKYNPDRPGLIRQQAAYNKEVSILSGIAKHVGFPAAPEIKGLEESELEEDLRAMEISCASSKPPTFGNFEHHTRETTAAARTTDPNAAEARYYEQTLWANSQYPAHQHQPPPPPPQQQQQLSGSKPLKHAHAPLSTTSKPSFSTPVFHRRRADADPPSGPPNGSGSTIDLAASNPPSSAGAAHGSSAPRGTHSAEHAHHHRHAHPRGNFVADVDTPVPRRAQSPNRVDARFIVEALASRDTRQHQQAGPGGAAATAPYQAFPTSGVHGAERA
ncbi:Sds3-like-domain-containing protein [Lineolata rhizophorae]|uniref:Sds3-like-domain-containing protein n=1 Tax=Lineolata rhizophorae TaxID=578093 RepID=A0A6A6P7V1_9PEZI|nr:Sds3-like-domain-containing protein [Lineolata rhizophorae]